MQLAKKTLLKNLFLFTFSQNRRIVKSFTCPRPCPCPERMGMGMGISMGTGMGIAIDKCIGSFVPVRKSICTRCTKSTGTPFSEGGIGARPREAKKTEFCTQKDLYTRAKPSFLKGQAIEWSQLFTWIYFLAFLIIPICALLTKAFSLSELVSIPSAGSLKEIKANTFIDFISIATQPIALSAYSVTFSMAAIASLFNAFFGFILAWVLVRYNFPFKRFLDAAIDLPFAVPTSVAGLTLATVYSPQGWIGSHLQKAGIQVIYTRVGVATAMVFVSLPFVVRSLQPVLQEIDEQIEEAAFSLGASPYTTFRRVLFPPLLPAFLTGVTLGFSRAIGEYGSLVLVSSNIPYKDLIASVLIFQNLESYSLGEATVIATVVLLVSFSILLAVSSLQSWTRNKHS